MIAPETTPHVRRAARAAAVPSSARAPDSVMVPAVFLLDRHDRATGDPRAHRRPILLARTGAHFDLASLDFVLRVVELAQHAKVARLVIDMRATHRLFDSGLALLLLLHRRLTWLRHNIYIVNGDNEEIRHRLRDIGLKSLPHDRAVA